MFSKYTSFTLCFTCEQLCNDQSSKEVPSSEEEYVPDSTGDSDSSWEDRSEPLCISRKRTQNSQVSSSQSVSKKKRLHQESFEEGERRRFSEAAESLSEDGISTRLSEVSGVTAKVGNTDAEGIIDTSDVRPAHFSKTSSSLRNKTYCYICGKLHTKFTRHLKPHEKTHAEVSQVLSLPKKSKNRLKMLVKLRNKGNHRHNSEVLASGIGSLKLRRTSKKKLQRKD